MFTTDLDGTYLKPSPDNMKKNAAERTFDSAAIEQTEDALQKCGFDTVLINTGRNYSELKEIENILKKSKMPIYAISLEDGKRLLKKPTELTPQQWMAQLFNKSINYLKFEDKTWAEENKKPLQLIGNYLMKEQGFIHRKNDGEEIIYSKPCNNDKDNSRWEVSIVPPGIKVKVNVRGTKNINKEELAKYSSELTKEIKKHLEENGYQTDVEMKEELTVISTFSRPDINKGTVADYVKNGIGEDTYEVRAGDGENDAKMFENNKIIGIQTGDNPNLKKLLANKNNIIQVPLGKLADGIILASKKLDAMG